MAEEVQGQATEQPALPDTLSPNEAVGALAQMLESEEKSEKTETPRDDKGRFTKPEDSQTESEAKTEETQEEAKEETVEAPKEESQTRKLRLKYKGEEKEVDEPEAIELAQKGYDYTQKSQQLAKEREELQARVKTEQEAARKAYESQLETYRQATLRLADPEVLNTDLSKLALEDPAKAQHLFFKRQQIAETLQAIQAEQQKLTQQRETEARETYQKTAREAVEKLQERIPNWNNDLYGKILKGAVDQYGFQQTEVNAITDHRAIEVLNDALKWREYQSAKPKTVEKRVAAVPKVQKPGSAEKPNPDAERFKGSMARLYKSGNRSDAVDAVRQLIEAGKL